MRQALRWVVGFALIASAFVHHLRAEQASRVPFELYEGHMILVKASLVGTGKTLYVMIDTGASHSVLSFRGARKINAQRFGAKETGSAFGSRKMLDRVIVRGLRLGSHTITMACYLAELPWKKVDLLLGLDALAQSSFTIDYAKKEIEFASTSRLSHSMRFDREDGLLIVDVEIGKEMYRLSIDSGAPYTCLWQAHLGKSLRSLKTEESTMKSMAGISDIRTTVLPLLRLGACEWKELFAWILSGRQNTAEGRDGVVGLASLNLTRVHFDFDQAELSWDQADDEQGLKAE